MLGSWSDGSAKKAVVDFVARVTKEGGKDFVPRLERIAVFDNDGTLWCEQPFQVQLFFLLDRVRQLAATDASLKDRQPYKAVLEADHEALHAIGKKGLFELACATHTGMSDEEFQAIAEKFFMTSKHPKFGWRFDLCTYKPQVELLAYLRENGFKTFIVSGGGVDLMRAFAEQAYGIPPEQVIGSSMKLRLETKDGKLTLMKVGELNSFDDREVKVENIALHIGRRPILAFGNSDGDLAMMRYTLDGPGARLALLLHHDDAEREMAYDREFRLSPLSEALDRAPEYGIRLVSMKRDWKTVFEEKS